MEPCIHFLPSGKAPGCVIRRALQECGCRCPAYLPDAYSKTAEVWSAVHSGSEAADA